MGDYQTPPALAERVCELLRARGLQPRGVLEPTCGRGSFVLAGARAFPRARHVARDINPIHVDAARRACAGARVRCELEVGDFFTTDWSALARRLPGPLLVLGNPPWITSADLTCLGSDNAPARANLKGLAGLDARTGKGNFDISEWMVLHLVERLQRPRPRALDVAVLIKTAVARRLLAHLAGPQSPLPELRARLDAARMWRIDARAAFAAAVDACLVLLRFAPAGDPAPEDSHDQEDITLRCPVHDGLDAPAGATLGVERGRLIADLDALAACRALLGQADPPWRSGLKHDCARVMELRREGAAYRNGLRERVALEPARVFPLLKGGDLARAPAGDEPVAPRRYVIVPQDHVGEDTSPLARAAPRTWAYLAGHGARLDARRSAIYRGRPRFAIFGVGPYAFAPWKVAVSGLHKRVQFALVGPHEGKPVMLDDTCYFLGFPERDAAAAALWLLRREPARRILRAFLFRDMKRPVTKELLGRLELKKLATAALRGPVPAAVRAGLHELSQKP
ncbi:MAG: SAM-dependent methyltransferase [Myxococcales bacterium]|nr:SAM-dependent methyltransferase [Myxococcales bacterium]